MMRSKCHHRGQKEKQIKEENRVEKDGSGGRERREQVRVQEASGDKKPPTNKA